MAPENGPLPRIIRFATFAVDLQTRELRKGGLKLKLHGQPFEVLAMLLEKPGEVVGREQLRERLWPTDTFVDFDHGVNTAINRLREALGDSADNPRFIETLPRRGYRFIASVEPGASVAQVAVPVSAAVPETPIVAGTQARGASTNGNISPGFWRRRFWWDCWLRQMWEISDIACSAARRAHRFSPSPCCRW
jgi:DNA-binding winged helix-turn-helix (wHTH) protein